MSKETVRERILQAVAEAMQGVVKANSYNTDIGHEVHRSRRVFFPDELPVATLIDGEETTTRDEYGGDRSIMEISVQVLLKEIKDDTYSQVINAIVGEFKDAIESGDNTWNDLAEDTQCTGTFPAYPEEGIKTVGAEITYQITYSTMHGDPYTAFNP